MLAVVVTGLYLSHHAPQAGYATRLQDQVVWQAADTMLKAFVFALIGLQLPAVLRGVADIGPFDARRDRGARHGGADQDGLGVSGDLLAASAVHAGAARDPAPPWQVPAVISWAGMRGVVTLAAAFSIPLATGSARLFLAGPRSCS